ncbi:integrase core domain-containing protein [Catalinimonas niigatensis]|uniref:integrase core domain-containing protein n=1 Tax=Catalinimonas niigatensis TaxID=1397264 RepID=UPI00389924FD
MSRRANCWDNAVAESFFRTLKTKLIHQMEIKSIQAIKIEVFEFIEVWYNRQRIHASLGYRLLNSTDKINFKKRLNFLSNFLLQVQRELFLCSLKAILLSGLQRRIAFGGKGMKACNRINLG